MTTTSTASAPEARAAAAAERGKVTTARRGAPPAGQAARLAPAAATFRNGGTVSVGGKTMHQLDGYASVTEIEYEMWDMFGPFGETIAATAFDRTLADSPDVAFLVNHKGLTMARTTNGTLALDVDPRGLHMLSFLNPSRVDVADLLVAIDDKNITEMSFAFMITDAEWSEDYEHFRILEVDLDRGDVSAVNYGANPYTSISARSREIMAELDHLPDGAGRAAFRSLAARFAADSGQGGAGMDTDGTETGLPFAFGPAGMRAAARAQTAQELAEVRAAGDPVEAGRTGRSLKLVEAMLQL